MIVDLGTGSGAIGLSLAAELPLGAAEVWLTDVSADALDVARANAIGLGRRSVTCASAWARGSMPCPTSCAVRLDLVVANPPYIADDDPEIEAQVRQWEPAAALFAGADGLDAIRPIVRDAPAWLRPGGWLVIEIGHRQGPAVLELLRQAGLSQVSVEPDMAGRDRFAVARRPG